MYYSIVSPRINSVYSAPKMGAEASKPVPGKSIQVIGAGLPRTGTASFSEALAILLDGPVYHSGTQMFIGPEKNIRGWIDILKRTPITSITDRKFIDYKIASLMDGYAAVVDTPTCCFVGEMMELYPDAKVICTVRDPDRWAESMDKMSQTSLQWFLTFALFWLPGLRYLPEFGEVINVGRWRELYGPPPEGEKYVLGRQIWERHIEYLERTVPKDKLVYFNVKVGWEPLCKALDLPVPVGEEFPKINDGVAMEAFAKRYIIRGLMRWAIAFGVGAISVGVLMYGRE